MLLDHVWLSPEGRRAIAAHFAVAKLQVAEGEAAQVFAKHVQAVNIGEVARYAREHVEEHLATADVALGEEYPTIAPPWNLAWYEWDDPAAFPGQRLGVLLSSYTMDGASFAEGERVLARAAWEHLYGVHGEAAPPDSRFAAQQAKWPGEVTGKVKFLMLGTCFVRDNRAAPGEVVCPQVIWLMADAEGRCQRNGWGTANTTYRDDKGQRVAVKPYVFAAPVMYANCVANCSNVERVAIPLAKPHKKREKRFGPLPVFRFVELRIASSKARAAVHKGEREAGATAKRALHVARGHFKDYRAGKGLLGKHRGVYWWRPQVRGGDSTRLVEKHYSIAKP